MPTEASRGRLLDAQDRRRAVSVFDQTVVVTAGAGTGKTALLVERMLNILMRPGEPAPITSIVALTFSRRGAAEMRVRVREALLEFVDWSRGGGSPEDCGHLNQVYRDIAERWGLSAAEIRGPARRALEDLERAPISTIHSFAAQLLRMHPVEAGVDPLFQEDEGQAFDERFDAAWEDWLAEELGPDAPRPDAWNAVLDEISLEHLRTLARALCDEVTDLDAVEGAMRDGSLFRADSSWLAELAASARGLLESHPGGEKVKTGKLLAAAIEVFESLAGGSSPEELAHLAEAVAGEPGKTKVWTAEDVRQAKPIVKAAQDLLAARREAIAGALGLFISFARRFRAEFARAGYLSFSALLVRARDLLRDHAAIREELKDRFRHVLVDEFQDTDPIQYEIVFYLSEKRGQCASRWKEVELEPGKLFIVGDPKQSIYSFRRADMAAYDEVTEDTLGEEACQLNLTTNFRSRDRLIDAANGIFEKVFRPEKGIQPEHQALKMRPGGEASLDSQRVEVRLVRPEGEARFRYSADATQAEARYLARWLRTELIDHEALPDGEGGTPEVRWGDVAILLRKMTNVGAYTEALKAEGVPFIVEGQRSFYVTQEVTDLLNLLSVLADPSDRVAFVGVLRSGVGALTDSDVALLAGSPARDYLEDGKLPEELSDRAGVQHFLATLRELHRKVSSLPVDGAIDEIAERLPVIEAAMASGGGEQGRSNLLKVRRMAVEQGSRPETTFRGFVSFLKGRARELAEEGENPLAEEGQDAVRILTIHKAKGLEFPVVVLPGLHTGMGGGSDEVWVERDWTTGRMGLRVGGCWTPEGVRLAMERKARDDAEERRVFYVAATRAREKLVFSAAPATRSSGEMLGFLDEAVGLSLESAEPEELSCGKGALQFIPVEAPGPSERRPATEPEDVLTSAELESWSRTWEERRARHDEASSKRLVLRPSAATEGESDEQRAETAVGARAPEKPSALAVGSVAHAVLERLDFENPERDLADLISREVADRSEDAKGLQAELEGMLGRFVRSDAFERLRRSKILAREMPCVFAWEEGETPFRASAEGFMDLVCEEDGDLVVVDFKTDRIGAADAAKHAERYRRQGEMYAHAVADAIGRKVRTFRVVFLRPCMSIDLPLAK